MVATRHWSGLENRRATRASGYAAERRRTISGARRSGGLCRVSRRAGDRCFEPTVTGPRTPVVVALGGPRAPRARPHWPSLRRPVVRTPTGLGDPLPRRPGVPASGRRRTAER